MTTVLKQSVSAKNQRGALILVTLLILLIISILGMSSMDSTGLEMQMSSNSRAQQQAFEAAEYTLSWVENSIKEGGYYSNNSLDGTSPGCGAACFKSTCALGYCFIGINASNRSTCKLNAPSLDPYETASNWSNSGFHKTLSVPNTTITAKYMIEFRCYTTRDDSLPYDPNNSSAMFRITTYVTAEGGRARVMLRSTIKEV